VPKSLGGEGLREGRSTSTDESGRFEFKDLPNGPFQLQAGKAGYVTMAYGQRRPTESGRPIELADGQRMDAVQFNLPRGGVVTGRITDELGEAVAGLEVRVIAIQLFRGPAGAGPSLGPVDADRRPGPLPCLRAPGRRLPRERGPGMDGMSWGAQSESRSGFAPAVEYLEEGQDRDPEFLQQMRPYATTVQLGDAERKMLTLRMVADR
jgi:hypothetical protein